MARPSAAPASAKSIRPAISTPPARCSVAPTRSRARSFAAINSGTNSVSPPRTSTRPVLLLPPNGVYAAHVSVGGRSASRRVSTSAVARPFRTSRPAPRVEVHLLDFNGDLYGQELEVTFVAKLRDEQKFAFTRRTEGADRSGYHCSKKDVLTRISPNSAPIGEIRVNRLPNPCSSVSIRG